MVNTGRGTKDAGRNGRPSAGSPPGPAPGALAHRQLQEIADDRLAVTAVVAKMSAATDSQSALRIALETVRSQFGWAYGSYWAIDPSDGLLHFQVESGSAGDEFRKVTLSSTFAEGVGLTGRAWRARDLVFVRDLAELTDCVRAPAAGRPCGRPVRGLLPGHER